MKKKILLAAVFGAAVLASGCSGQKNAVTASAASDPAASTTKESANETAKETEAGKKEEAGTGTFTVGFDQDFPPMGFVGENGEYTGFDLELAQEVANRLGKKFVPQPIAWDAKDMELESGNIDCIWNGFTITGREEGYTWTKPYMENSQVFVVGKDSSIKTLADLSGKIVEVQADSSAEKALQSDEKLAGTFGTLQTTPDYNTAFMDLEMGAVDAIAMDVIVAAYQIEQRKADFIILDEALAAEEYGVGFKKGNETLRDQVQEQLEAMSADGTLKKISEKWFGKDVTTVK
ncbi:amino acid ABC transporter substrate-binding protein [Lacrimispora saccharolytica]|uniref:Extracellular solute-binding protein family 3 n=1 Tax=Lacrimispora saccharolytica (strain ATCC 35040 / DSM 2544 / NRCC 2533 / WM1) TaxID=610130 RepID=D9R2L6_LACSW|nr:amino acid ABC transporter substrate-binding protein [Lacrimispora saccharolytica]ADL06640.1 extracellular solute-binding protein family 3 [[Clostridium] saccharolyticum WM1]QRV19288.1 amino acid ABC transporter substrate-binding protein [Lacrimispora saccharolytica]